MNDQNDKMIATQDERVAPSYRKPDYTVRQEEDAYRLEVWLPGIAKDAARITLDGNLLMIEAEAPSIAESNWKPYRREIPDGGFKLSLELNVEIDGDAITARTADGVLTIRMPLAAKAAKRTIAIE